jgi:GTP diphosphokinase / guanosine-3',5'-bis(diphosphate) 3'-diphosphatase
VHTYLGFRAGQAKVNGRIVPLNYVLKNGDMVEIIPDKRRKLPSEDWLNFVVTTHARREIARARRKDRDKRD